jgi:hypothetical protein
MFYKTKNLLINTPDGFKKFEGVQVVKKFGRITLSLYNGQNLKCSPNHQLLTTNGWKHAFLLTPSDTLVGKNFTSRIFHVEFEEGTFKYFDIVGVENQQFFSNDIVSHNCEFIGSSNTLINGSKLRTLVIKSPVKTSPNIKFYADPRPNRVYVMTVDTARGVGGDYSAFVVFDITEIPYRTCCVYRNNLISPLLYPNIIRSIATAYNSATVLVESNDIGQQVADILHYELEYEGVLVTTNKGRSGQAISGGFSRTAHYGVRTTKSIKKIGCANLKTLIESDKLIVEDYDMIYELSRFILNGTSYEAEDGNDDTVMCLVMFGWLIQQPYIREMSNTDVRRNLLDENMRILEEEALPIGFIDNGIPQDPNEVVTLHQDSFEKWMRE